MCESVIIACSSCCEPDDFVKYKAAGADHMWTKPLPTAAVIHDDLNNLLACRNLSRQMKHLSNVGRVGLPTAVASSVTAAVKQIVSTVGILTEETEVEHKNEGGKEVVCTTSPATLHLKLPTHQHKNAGLVAY